jgi:hypothetical protein
MRLPLLPPTTLNAFDASVPGHEEGLGGDKRLRVLTLYATVASTPTMRRKTVAYDGDDAERSDEEEWRA